VESGERNDASCTPRTQESLNCFHRRATCSGSIS
jgi:hypothetical protein